MAATKKISVIGAASCLGAQDYRCETGPLVLRSQGLISHLQKSGYEVSWRQFVEPYHPVSDDKKITTIANYCNGLANYVREIARERSFIAILGGDHSVAIGTWAGMYQAISLRGRMGLIWIDAHMDSHTSETSPSGAIHGMPLATLLGRGEPELTNIGVDGPTLLPEHVCLVGVRSFETEEIDLLTQLGVRIFFMDEIKQRGLAAVIQEAERIVNSGTVGFGVSIDLDVIDPRDAPGVGSPEPDGLHGEELVNSLSLLKHDPRLLAIEIVEFNPIRDKADRTAKLAMDLLLAVI